MIATAVAITIALALAGWSVLRWLTPHPYSGTVMQAPTAAPLMDGLVWDDGTSVNATDLGGGLVLVYLGYTSCPDVCSTTLVGGDRALDRLGDDVDRVRVLMVSIDPGRDDPERVGEYVRSFDPSFRGVSGSVEAVERVASTYGIFFAQDEPFEGGGDTMSPRRRCWASTPIRSPPTWRSSCDPGVDGCRRCARKLRHRFARATGPVSAHRRASRSSTAGRGRSLPRSSRSSTAGRGRSLPRSPTLRSTSRSRIRADVADEVVAMGSERCVTIVPHVTSFDDDGVASMMAAGDALRLAAGGSIEMEPNGLHLMCLGLDAPIADGDTFAVDLEFAAQEGVSVQVAVEDR